jgi:hypothetical protein
VSPSLVCRACTPLQVSALPHRFIFGYTSEFDQACIGLAKAGLRAGGRLGGRGAGGAGYGRPGYGRPGYGRPGYGRPGGRPMVWSRQVGQVDGLGGVGCLRTITVLGVELHSPIASGL